MKNAHAILAAKHLLWLIRALDEAINHATAPSEAHLLTTARHAASAMLDTIAKAADERQLHAENNQP